MGPSRSPTAGGLPVDPGGPKRRIPSLDGWRAVAVLLVIASHELFFPAFNGVTAALGPWLDGQLGVRIFFVISGFIITRLMAQEAARTGRVSLQGFYLRRVLRILPVYFAYLLALAAITAAGLHHEDRSSWIGALTFSRNFLGRGDSATMHFWSLAVEEQFYLVWPLLFANLLLHVRPRLALSGLAVVIVVSPLVRGLFPVDATNSLTLVGRLTGRWSTLRVADALAWGCVLALRFDSLPSGPRRTRQHSWAVLALAVIGAYQLRTHDGGPVPDWLVASAGLALEEIAVAYLIWYTLHPSAVGFRLLNNRGIVALGGLSYSLYVWHYLFWSESMGPWFRRFWPYDWRIWWIPAVVTAYCSYRWLETPLMRLRSRFRSIP